MDKTYNEGYRDGFKEGFKDGYEAAKKELEKKSEDAWSSSSDFGGGFGGTPSFGSFGGNSGFGFNSGFGNGVTPPEFPKEKKSITQKFKEMLGQKGKDDYDPARDNIVDEYGCFEPAEPLGGEDEPWPDDFTEGDIDPFWGEQGEPLGGEDQLSGFIKSPEDDDDSSSNLGGLTGELIADDFDFYKPSEEEVSKLKGLEPLMGDIVAPEGFYDKEDKKSEE